MSRENRTQPEDSRRLLVERVAASRYISKSARLRNLLLYLCERVLDGPVGEIHEQEVGHKVFGRPPDYDTATDNIVRVHASLLRKRLDQYFSTEGRGEPLIIAIPKGNYAPQFRERPTAGPGPRTFDQFRSDWRIWMLGALAAVFAVSSLWLWLAWRAERDGAPALPDSPAVRALWSQVIEPGRQTDIVLDDAALGLYQELLDRPIGLSEYFDRSYLRKLDQTVPQAELGRDAAESIVLRRHSSYAASSLLWRLHRRIGALLGQSTLQFARDYSFRGLKTSHVILLGNSRSNPWIEPFESRLGLRWTYHPALRIYYPVDTRAGPEGRQRFRITAEVGEPREGYCMIALLPNLGETGNVLIISATGGSAMNAGGDFLADEQAVSRLRKPLPSRPDGRFPYFETLLRTKGRSALPKDVAVVICRPPGSQSGSQ